MTTRLKLKLRDGRMPSFGLFLAAGMLLLATGCTKEESPAPDGTPLAVTFTAGIEQAATPATAAAGVPQTRTTDGGDRWSPDDPVGIFMLTAGGSLTASTNVLADNVQYTVTDASTGALSGGPVYYPKSGNVDFIAYYPYGTASPGATTAGTVNTTDYTYNISVDGQTDAAAQNAIDVLYAIKTNVAKSGTAVNLAFAHVMSKITLNVNAGEGIAQADVRNLAASSVVFGGMPVTAAMDLRDGALTVKANIKTPFSPLKAATATPTFDATFTAILVPQPTGIEQTGRTVVFTLPGIGGLTWDIPNSEPFEAGTHYTYPVEIRRTGVTVGKPDIRPWDEKENGSDTATEIGKGIAKVFIPAGTFLMGSPENESDRKDRETQHRVFLSKDFCMSKYEITNAQYAAFLNANRIGENAKYTFTDNFTKERYENVLLKSLKEDEYNSVKWDNGTWVSVDGKENYPVTWVTWYGALAYAQWVGGTLPTEAQWEYACRAGTMTAFSHGDEADGAYMWYRDNNTPGGGIKEVGTKLPNPWGLYDMHGNAREWCYDWWDWDNETDYSPDPIIDPVSPNPGDHTYRVVRGGNFLIEAPYCRSAYRMGRIPREENDDAGFRVVFVL